MSNLEDFYAGDAAWRAFAALFRGQLTGSAEAAELTRLLGGDEALAEVIVGTVGDAALWWIEQPIPALSGLSPIRCVESARRRERLREMLLRMPR